MVVVGGDRTDHPKIDGFKSFADDLGALYAACLYMQYHDTVIELMCFRCFIWLYARIDRYVLGFAETVNKMEL